MEIKNLMLKFGLLTVVALSGVFLAYKNVFANANCSAGGVLGKIETKILGFNGNICDVLVTM